MYESNDLKEALIKQEELYFTLQEKLRYNIFIPDSIEGLVKRDHHTDGPLKALALALESAKNKKLSVN